MNKKLENAIGVLIDYCKAQNNCTPKCEMCEFCYATFSDGGPAMWNDPREADNEAD